MPHKQVDTLSEFAEFCHNNYYTGCSRAYPGAEWEYGYDHEVTTMVDLFIISKRIIDTVVNDMVATDPKDTTDSLKSAPQQAVIEARIDPFDFVESCEENCTEERHAYHQGQWDMATRIEAQLKLKEEL